MKEILRKLVEKTGIDNLLWQWSVKNKQRQELLQWQKIGQPMPPPHRVKQQTLASYAKDYCLTILVETGTYYGEMVEAMRENFHQIYSIELSRELHDIARKRFKKAKNVVLIHGDSSIEIGNIIREIDRPALFWLDGHYSGGVTAKAEKNTPIYEELNHILSAPQKGHVIVIDDARCFGRDPDYPSIEELKSFITSKREGLNFAVINDSIRITPRA